MFFIIKTVFSLKGVQLKRFIHVSPQKNQHLRSDVDFFNISANPFVSYLKYQWCLRLAKIALLVIVMMTSLMRSARIKGATTKVNAFWRSVCVTSIKPIAPDTKRRALLRRLAKKIVKMLDLALVNRDVIHARNGKKRRKPAVGPRKCEAPLAPPANTGKPKKPKSR